MRFKAIFTTAIMATAAIGSFAAGRFQKAPPAIQPQVAAMVPVDSALDVPLDQRLSVTFRRPMNALTINGSTFTLQHRGMPVFGTVSYTGATATFTPAVILADRTRYTATLTTGVRSLSGAPLAGSLVWSFTTGPRGLWTGPTKPQSPQLPVNLGTAGNFTVLAGTQIVANGTASAITGDIGLSPGTGAGIIGFPPSTVTGTMYTVDATGPAGSVMDPTRVNNAQGDLTAAMIDAANRVVPLVVYAAPGEIGGLTLAADLYKFTSTAQITLGNLTLDGQGSNSGVWIFQIATDLNVATGIRVNLINGASASNVFWQVGAQAAMLSSSHMEGNIMAGTAITFGTTATLTGRALAKAEVTFAGGFGGGVCTTSAPGTLTATAVPATSSIDLSWSAVAGATSYNVYRGTVSGGPYTLLTTVTAPATAYSDAAVTAGVTYYYVVNAVNVCASGNSPQASAMLPALCTTSAPGTLTATANLAPLGIDLSWSAIAGATSYNIYRATVSGGPYTLLTSVAAPATTYSDAAVIQGITYYYVIRAFNLCESGNSPEASAMLPAGCLTAAPATLTAVASPGKVGIDLSWSAVTGATGYQIHRSTVLGGPYTLIATVSALPTTYSDLSILNNNVRYYYVIRAVNTCVSLNSPEASAIRVGC